MSEEGCYKINLVLSTEFIVSIGRRREILRMKFWVLGLRLSSLQLSWSNTLGNYCLKIGPSKCPAFPSPLVQNLARPFSSRAKSKNSPGFPPLWGEWYEYTNSSRKIRNPRGKSFLLIPCLPYSVQFSKNTAVVKKHFDTIYKFRNFWF